MQRDMVAIASNARDKIPREYGITVEEVQALHEMRIEHGADGELDAYTTAFRYGFALGVRAAKRGRVNDKV